MGPDASLIDAIAVTEPRKASLYFDIKRNTLDDGPLSMPRRNQVQLRHLTRV